MLDMLKPIFLWTSACNWLLGLGLAREGLVTLTPGQKYDLMDVYCRSSDLPPHTTCTTKFLTRSTPLLGFYYGSNNSFWHPLGYRDAICFHAVITGCSHNNNGFGAIQLFPEMLRTGFSPETILLGTLALIVEDEKQCQPMHCEVVKSGTGFFTSVINALICELVGGWSRVINAGEWWGPTNKWTTINESELCSPPGFTCGSLLSFL